MAKQLRFRFSPYSAQYLPHSDNVVFYKDGWDLGFMHFESKQLCVVVGNEFTPELIQVYEKYVSMHSKPVDDDCIMI